MAHWQGKRRLDDAVRHIVEASAEEPWQDVAQDHDRCARLEGAFMNRLLRDIGPRRAAHASHARREPPDKVRCCEHSGMLARPHGSSAGAAVAQQGTSGSRDEHGATQNASRFGGRPSRVVLLIRHPCRTKGRKPWILGREASVSRCTYAWLPRLAHPPKVALCQMCVAVFFPLGCSPPVAWGRVPGLGGVMRECRAGRCLVDVRHHLEASRSDMA